MSDIRIGDKVTFLVDTPGNIFEASGIVTRVIGNSMFDVLTDKEKGHSMLIFRNEIKNVEGASKYYENHKTKIRNLDDFEPWWNK